MPAAPTNMAQGAKNGERFVASLRDAREVWVEGQRVPDVTVHSPFRGIVGTLSRLYDLQCAPGTQEVMTYLQPNGLRASYSYLPPRSALELTARRTNTETWAREAFGLMNRPPDFCASIITGLYAERDLLGGQGRDFAVNAERYHAYARDNDLCLGHALHDPPMDKSLRPEQDPERCIRVIEERDDGVVVRGARTMSTLSPFCNELLVYPAFPLNERELEFAIFFAVPVAAPGLKLICREPFAAGRGTFDHPAAARFDEQDAIVIFDDVFIPWERVFVYRSPSILHQIFRGQSIQWAVFSSNLVMLQKLELMIGVCHLLAQAGGVEANPFVVEEMGELVVHKQLLRDTVACQEHEGYMTPAGYFSPRRALHFRPFVTMTAERLASIVEHVATSSIIATPMAADLDVPELRPLIDRYFRGKDISAEQRTRLAKLAWDLSCDSFGGRQTLYERLHSGDPHVLMALAYNQYDKTYAVGQVRRLLNLPD